jgi:hypothetical protein
MFARVRTWTAQTWASVFAGLTALIAAAALIPQFTPLFDGEFDVSAFSVNRVDSVPADVVNVEDNRVIEHRTLPSPVIDITVKNASKETVVVTGELLPPL